jgi:Domain of unknown function (DUF4193)
VREKEEVREEEGAEAEPTEASLDEILAKKAEEGAAAEEGAEEESVIPPGGTDRVETLTVKVVPQQPTEFTCKKCFLVKHRSQLADKRRMICRDCAAR